VPADPASVLPSFPTRRSSDLFGFLLIGWMQHRTEQTLRPLVFLLLIIALQTTFDLSTPNVSFACHALGLASGVLFGVVWTWRSRDRKSTRLNSSHVKTSYAVF